MVHSILDHTQKPKAGLRVMGLLVRLALVLVLRVLRLSVRSFVRGRGWQSRDGGRQEALQLGPHARQGATAMLDDVGGMGVIEQGQQKVFQTGELVSAPGGINERPAYRLF
jgi:hypothetical protein